VGSAKPRARMDGPLEEALVGTRRFFTRAEVCLLRHHA
jgi:hypothetical protein